MIDDPHGTTVKFFSFFPCLISWRMMTFTFVRCPQQKMVLTILAASRDLNLQPDHVIWFHSSHDSPNFAPTNIYPKAFERGTIQKRNSRKINKLENSISRSCLLLLVSASILFMILHASFTQAYPMIRPLNIIMLLIFLILEVIHLIYA